MARPKAFDRDAALARAVGVFREHGYEGTSTGRLLAAMGISRQSLYDTFGDKRALYLEALHRYNSEAVAELLRAFGTAASPLGKLEAALCLPYVPGPASDALRGCLAIHSILEFGRTRAEVNAVNEASAETFAQALRQLIVEGQAAGEIAGDVDVATAVQFLNSVMLGLKVSARGGASPEALRAAARLALRALGSTREKTGAKGRRKD